MVGDEIKKRNLSLERIGFVVKVDVIVLLYEFFNASANYEERK